MREQYGQAIVVTFAVRHGDQILQKNVEFTRALIEDLNTSSLGQIMKDYMMQVFKKYDEEANDAMSED